jgi:diamine N-acetyltransferase
MQLSRPSDECYGEARKDYYFVDGQYHDALIGSILRNEYYAVREPSAIIPAEDKEAARRIAAEFLEKNPIARGTVLGLSESRREADRMTASTAPWPP